MKHSGGSNSKLVRKSDMNGEKLHSPGSEEVDLGSHDTKHTGCGFWGCQPGFLQIFARPIVFMIILNIYCLVEGAIVSGEHAYIRPS